jgi:Dirigent-like protein
VNVGGFTCTTVAVYAHGSNELCTGWPALPAGQLEVTGKSRAQDTVHHWAVTGGTGAYRAARGTLTARDLSDVSDLVTIRLG